MLLVVGEGQSLPTGMVLTKAQKAHKAQKGPQPWPLHVQPAQTGQREDVVSFEHWVESGSAGP